MRVIQRRSGQLIHLLYLVAKIFLTYKRLLNILHATKRKFLSINKLINFQQENIDNYANYSKDYLKMKQFTKGHIS